DAGFPAAPLSGDVPQNQRERTIEALRRGRIKLIVATDVAARGIDVKSISHVFNFDVPEDTEVYIHRIGRTGRAGRTGEAVLFVENRQRRLLQNIERATGHPIEKMELPTAEQVQALQLERFGEQLKERLTRKSKADEEAPKPPALRGFIEEICNETGRDPFDVAAFLVGPAMNAAAGGSGTQPVGVRGRDAKNARPAERSSRSDRDNCPTPRAPMGGQAEPYRVAVGRADGVRAGHLVGAIANETGLDGQDINAIRIFDSHSTLTLPTGMPSEVFDILQRTTVLGKPLRIRRQDQRSDGGGYGQPSHRPSGPPRQAMNAEGHKVRLRKTEIKASASPSPDENNKPRFKVKFKPPTSGQGKPKFAAKSKSKDKTKPKGKFKARNAGNNADPGNSKSAKKYKASAGGGGSKSGKVGTNSPGHRSSPGTHSLSPAPFAGGKKKPIRRNKRVRPKS
ncbi:MAG: helicase-related protein, partial [Planctomycetota bacterium]